MVKHLYPNFLHDGREYSLSEEYWIQLWEQLDPMRRAAYEWKHPWFEPLPPSLSEGNPIFSAVSPRLRRGIRVIQHEPTDPGLEIQAWPDTFGGDSSSPDRIEELVISCALSDLASRIARAMMETWVNGEALCVDEDHLESLIEPHRELSRSESA